MKERNFWVVSDTHFGHEVILKADFARRERFFNSSVNEMDECMVEKWNSVVKPGDTIYHCGDVMFGSKNGFKERVWSKLNGNKKLIIGNHDNVKYLTKDGLFSTIDFWKRLRDFGVILSHIPLHPQTLQETRWGGDLLLNVHGHTHSNKSPEGPYHCVCVEQTDFTPVNLEEIRDSEDTKDKMQRAME